MHYAAVVVFFMGYYGRMELCAAHGLSHCAEACGCDEKLDCNSKNFHLHTISFIVVFFLALVDNRNLVV